MIFLSESEKERLRLPIQIKGMGFRSLQDQHHSEYIGGMVKGPLPPLLGRKIDVNITLPSRIYIPTMK